MIEKLAQVPINEVWKYETDFTKWLEENIDVLSDQLDVEIANPEREQSAGTFSVDLVAEDENGNPVVIENQLFRSDHDHLGKLLTYVASFAAKLAIWIVGEPRQEHVSAVSWLNESSATAFYLFKLQAVRIGDSPAAPLLTLIVGPSEESVEVGKKKLELSESHILKKRFWSVLLDHSKTRTKLFTAISPKPQNWVGTGAGISGLAYNFAMRKHDTKIELYIDRGKEEENQLVFQQLFTVKDVVEASFGETLDWERLEGKRACRISKWIGEIGYADDEEKWPQAITTLVEAMIRFENALKPHVANLQV